MYGPGDKAPPSYDSVVGYPGSSYPAPYPVAPMHPGGPAYPSEPAVGGGAPYPSGPVSGSGPYPGQPPYGSGSQPNPYNNSGDMGDGTGFTMSAFSEKSVRHAFIRKVYMILTAQLLVTVAIICVFLLVTPVRYWVVRNSWFYYISYGVFLCTYISLVCCPSVRRRFPGNFIALAIFTLAFSYMTGTIASYHRTESVLIAAGITAALCLAITLFATQTRIDFTMCSAMLFVLTIVVFITGIVCAIVYAVSGPNRVLQAVYGGLGALLFGLYLAYDTQMILGGRKHEMSPEEYIYGSLQLYLDVVYLFLMILSLFGSKE